MWMVAAPIWSASPPAMMATGISTRPLGTMPVSAIDHEDCEAAKPRRKPGRNVSRNPLRPAVMRASGATSRMASRLWLMIASAWSSCDPPPAAAISVDSAGFTTDAGIAPVMPAT